MNEDPSPIAKTPVTTYRTQIARVVALVVVIGLTVYIVSLGNRAEEIALFGYPGIFLVNVMASATLLLPAPALIIVFAMGSVFNPLWVGVASALGATVGELSGYVAGFSGQAVVERADLYERFVDWTQRYGVWPILILAFIPNPLFDLAGIAAGALRMPIPRFMLATLVGKLFKMWAVAYAGFYGVGWVANLVQ